MNIESKIILKMFTNRLLPICSNCKIFTLKVPTISSDGNEISLVLNSRFIPISDKLPIINCHSWTFLLFFTDLVQNFRNTFPEYMNYTVSKVGVSLTVGMILDAMKWKFWIYNIVWMTPKWKCNEIGVFKNCMHSPRFERNCSWIRFHTSGFSHERNNACVFAAPMPSAKADDDVMLITAVSSDLDDISVSPCPFGTIVVPF